MLYRDRPTGDVIARSVREAPDDPDISRDLLSFSMLIFVSFSYIGGHV